MGVLHFCGSLITEFLFSVALDSSGRSPCCFSVEI